MEKCFPNKAVHSKHSALTVTFRMAQLRASIVQTVSTLGRSALEPQVVDHCYGFLHHMNLATIPKKHPL